MTDDKTPRRDDHPPSNGDQTRACGAPTRAGTPCRARALPGSPSGRCFAHADELAARRAEARRQGGRNRSNVARVRAGLDARLADVLDRLHAALSGLDDGDVDPAVAKAMAAVAGALVRVHEIAHVDARLSALESHLDIGTKGATRVRR